MRDIRIHSETWLPFTSSSASSSSSSAAEYLITPQNLRVPFKTQRHKKARVFSCRPLSLTTTYSRTLLHSMSQAVDAIGTSKEWPCHLRISRPGKLCGLSRTSRRPSHTCDQIHSLGIQHSCTLRVTWKHSLGIQHSCTLHVTWKHSLGIQHPCTLHVTWKHSLGIQHPCRLRVAWMHSIHS
jgi:hypothetical protein